MPHTLQFPVTEAFPELLKALTTKNRRAVLTAPPGSGKTVSVPSFLMQNLEGTILVLEPRRLAARSAARFSSSLLGEKPGERVGYRTKVDNAISCHTKIEYITEGILTRRLLSDNELKGVSCVIFDEFHERSLNADIGLALCLEVQILRPELSILIMSATLDEGELSTFLNCPVIRAEGKQYPVEIIYHPNPAGIFSEDEHLRHIAGTIRQALQKHNGSLLVFLPGKREILTVATLLTQLPPCTALHTLYGELPPEKQDSAIAACPAGQRKIVLSTAIAETSLTIEGIQVVIDCGLSRKTRFSPATEMTKLITERETQDSADQRAGRAGRLGPGICYRLWNKGDTLLQKRIPEIVESDLTSFLLSILAWGTIPEKLSFLTPPSSAALQKAWQTLIWLNTVRSRESYPYLTEHGDKLARIPLHPRLARMLFLADEHLDLACALAVLGEERFTDCDIRKNISLLSKNKNLLSEAGRLYKTVQNNGQFSLKNALADEEYCGVLISLAFPERIAQKTAEGMFRLASGRAALLPKNSLLEKETFLAIADMDAGTNTVGHIYTAAPIPENDIFLYHKRQIERHDIIEWDESKGMIRSVQRISLGSLILKETPLTSVEESRIRKIVLQEIIKQGPNCLSWTKGLRQWQARVLKIREIEGSEFPDVSDNVLFSITNPPEEHWLYPWLQGITKQSQFDKIPLKNALYSLLPYTLKKKLDSLLPKEITVPSGSSIPIEYKQEGSPVLAVKLQELFGLLETPKLCGGKCPLSVHLLSPAGRELAITSDLRSFWKNVYPSVRTEMRGRYPKHPWPEDPFNAIPTKKTKNAMQKEKIF